MDALSRKKIIIVAVILGIIITMTLFFFINKSSQQNQAAAPTSSNIPVGTDSNSVSGTYVVPKPTDSSMTIKGKNGTTIQTNNVYKAPVDNLSENGVSFADNSDYYIAYYPQNQGFLIVINDSDINAGRQKAEDAFLQALNVSKNQACNLQVSLGVSNDVSPTASGRDYGLSFCPNGRSFPN